MTKLEHVIPWLDVLITERTPTVPDAVRPDFVWVTWDAGSVTGSDCEKMDSDLFLIVSQASQVAAVGVATVKSIVRTPVVAS